MTDILPIFTEQANKIADRYITAINTPTTLHEMQRRLNSASDNLKNLNADLSKLANDLIAEYGVTVTDVLKEKLKEISGLLAKKVSKTNITG